MADRVAGNGDRERGALIIVENLPAPFDRRVWQEAQALREAGWRVSVICPTGKGHDTLRETLDGVEIYRHTLPLEAQGAASYFVEYAWALAAQMRLSWRVRREQGFDVVQACNPPDLMFLVAASHKLFGGKRFIFDHHDLSPELFAAKFGSRGPLRRALLGLLALAERATFRLADASIATNETFKRLAVARGGMAADRVWVVKSYPRIERFRRTVPDPALTASGRKLVGWIGIMGSQDGVDTLVRAMGVLRDRGRDDVGCVIVGDGPEAPRLRALAASLGLEDRVTFTGYLGGEALLTALSALDLGVIPDPKDDFNDKLSMNKVFEYMMLGLPFVMFDLVQARSEARQAALVARDGSDDALADAMVELLDDPARMARMGAWGRATAEREFLWDKEKAALLAAYDSVTPRPQGAPVREGAA